MSLYNEPTGPLETDAEPLQTALLIGPQLPPPQRASKMVRLFKVGSILLAVVLLLSIALVAIIQLRAPRAATTGGLGKGPFHTQGAQLLNANNQPVRITGVNWFGFETNTFVVHGLQERSYTSMLDQIKSLGYNTVRLPYSNQLFDSDSKPGGIDYSKNPDLQGLQGLQLMDKIVGYATSIGLAIILDQHRPDANAQSNLWYTAAYPETRWLSDWEMLVRHYKDNPLVIGADLHNEPRSPACWGCGQPALDWQAAAESMGNALLAIQPAWLIFVEGLDCYNGGTGQQGSGDCYWAGGNLEGVADHPITLNVANQLVYSVHDYPASVYNQPWFSAPDYPNNLPGIWDKYWGYIVKAGIAPVWVGEFGSRLATAQDQEWFSSLIHYLGQGASGISWTFWSWNPDSQDTGGILMNDWQTVITEKQSQLNAILFSLNAAQAGQTATSGTSTTPAASRGQSTLMLEYKNENSNLSANQLLIDLQLTNTGNSALSLQDFTMRYWYTTDTTQSQIAACYYATIACAQVQSRFVKMNSPQPEADTYLEVSFTGGELAPGASTEIKLGVHANDWSNYNQGNDYSFLAGAQNYLVDQHITLYARGSLVSGNEPA